jgi:beta-lactamase class A
MALVKTVKHSLLVACLALLPGIAAAQGADQQVLVRNIEKVIRGAKGHVGVGLLGLDFKDSMVLHNDVHYPMHSVYKFPLAMAVLHRVDEGKLSLSQEITLTKAQLVPGTWSPMVKAFPDQDIKLKLEDLIMYAVSYSDNNACDALFRLMGGTRPVQEYVRSLGIADMAVMATEEEMEATWSVQYTNWCQPEAMLHLLRLFYKGEVLSAGSNQFLMHCMTESSNPEGRIKGQLPKGTVVAHKTGTSGSRGSLIGATNDAGIVTLPDGRHYALVVYVSDYKGPVAKGEQVISEISKLCWDYLNRK